MCRQTCTNAHTCLAKMFYQSSFTLVSQRKHFTSDKSEADTQKGKLEVQKIYTMCLWNHFKVTFSSTSQNIISWRSFSPLHFMVVYTHPTTRGGRGRKEVALQRWNNRILWLNTKLHTGPRPCCMFIQRNGCVAGKLEDRPTTGRNWLCAVVEPTPWKGAECLGKKPFALLKKLSSF